MITRLYNTQTQQFISREFSGGYKVDGKKPELPEHIVELEIVRESPSEIDSATEYLEATFHIDLRSKKATSGWSIKQKPIQQVERETAERTVEKEKKDIRKVLSETPVPATIPEIRTRIENIEKLLL